MSVWLGLLLSAGIIGLVCWLDSGPERPFPLTSWDPGGLGYQAWLERNGPPEMKGKWLNDRQRAELRVEKAVRELREGRAEGTWELEQALAAVGIQPKG